MKSLMLRGAVCLCFVSSVSVASNGPIFFMEAANEQGASLSESVPAYYVVAKLKNDKLAGVPIIKKHTGTKAITFDMSENGDLDFSYGIYVPSGYVARYKIQSGTRNASGCNVSTTKRQASAPSDWDGYDTENVGGRVEQRFKRLTVKRASQQFAAKKEATQCKVVLWEIRKDTAYEGNTSNLLEVPVVAKNGLKSMPATKRIEGHGVGENAGSISLGVSEEFGGIPTFLRIKTGNRNYISLLHNIGAPTDDGMVWSISMTGVKGLSVPADKSIDLGSSQFAGHPDRDSPFGSIMWGMTMPLEKNGNALMSARQCDGKPCFVPMYSDWTSEAKPYGGTLPITLPRGVQPWDGGVKKIAIESLKDERGNATPIARLTYSMEYRAHKNFVASNFLPHLWFSLNTTDPDKKGGKMPVDVYLVTKKGETTKLSYDDLLSYNGEDPWRRFCSPASDKRKICASNPKKKGDTTCHCTSNDPEIKSIVFDYYNNNVALALVPEQDVFAKSVITTVFRGNTKGRPHVLAFVGNEFVKQSSKFSVNSPPRTDTYYLNVGTLADLKAAGFLGDISD